MSGPGEGEVDAIARRFQLDGEIVAVARLAGGHINDSFRVYVRGPAGARSYLLQRLNPQVFPRPDRVVENVAWVTRHITGRLRAARVPDWPRRVLVLVPTRDGGEWLSDTGGVWRAFVFLDGTMVRQSAASAADCHTAGRAFGEFLRLVADYDGPPLHETIPGFHDTHGRFARLEAVARADPCGRVAGARGEVEAALGGRSLAERLPPLLASGEIPLRVVHNDAKISNVLLDGRTGEALCVVDLDTVMPGTALYDFGDMVRSMASPTAEDEEELSRVAVHLPMFEALARGYLETAGAVLTSRERELLVFAGRLITLEQAVRFLTDHLEGDRYYRVARPGHNLIRCRTQLALFHSLTQAAADLETIVSRVAAIAERFSRG